MTTVTVDPAGLRGRARPGPLDPADEAGPDADTRRLRRPEVAIPAGVVATWVVVVAALGLWDDAAEGVVAAVTMAFGSLVGAATPQGGGAVAFPVLTKALDVPAAAARTFSLSIQAVGMGTAAAVILARRLPLARRALTVTLPAAAVSFLAVVVWGAEAGDPFRATPLDSTLVKVAFTVVVAAMAVLMTRLRDTSLARADVPCLRGANGLALAMVGLVGGALSALLGSGANVALFLALTLAFGVRPGVAVPTSVVLMAAVSVLGLGSLGLVDGQLLAGEVRGVDLGALWLAAAPVAAVGAPLGAWLASRASDRGLLLAVIGLASAEVLSTLLFLEPLRSDPLLLGGAVAGTAVLVHAAWWLHCRRLPALHRGMVTP